MRRKGSVTVFFSLFTAVFFILFQIALRSVQIAGGKVQAEAGVEEGLYSVFAGYDRELFERYHVFFLDAAYGTGTLQPGYLYQKIEKSLVDSCTPGGMMAGIRGENLWKNSKEEGAVTGMTLAADQQGRAFWIQAVDYMKETAGISGIQSLLEQFRSEEEILKLQEEKGNLEEARQAQESYEEAKEQAESGSPPPEGQTPEDPEEGASPAVPKDFVNPLDVIGQIQKRGILALVLPMDAPLSERTFTEEERLSQRTCETGMGMLHYEEDPDTVVGRLLFQQYMMTHLNCYGMKEERSGISYQLEYAVAGKASDLENLKSVAARLLAMREAANMVYLIQSPASQAKLHETALMISTAVGLPGLEGIVSLALTAAWAFGESVLDVRQLFDGGKIPLVKTAESWMLSLENLSRLPQLLEENRQKNQKGLSYREYLRLMLTLGDTQQQVLRMMDVAEQTMRGIKGKENFRLDQCVSYLQVEFEVSCGNSHFIIQREYGYEM